MLSKALSNKNLLLGFICITAGALSACAPYQAHKRTGEIQMHGLASWYGPGFAGRKTASGERFNPKLFTAAHRTLPMGSSVKVTNIENGKTVVVRINDRGPFRRDRIIDLSKAAAAKIGMLGTGTAPVRIAKINLEETEESCSDSSKTRRLPTLRNQKTKKGWKTH